ISICSCVYSLSEQYVGEGWRYFGSSLYFLSTKTTTWEESRQDSLWREADLVIINSEEEHIFLFGLKLRSWIGLTDKDEQGTWKWVNGTVLTKGYWHSGQPDNFQNQEDCAEIYYGEDNPVETWNDLSCGATLNWICEKVV
uniref:C-type lectin domain-containing protein n=1 Tax=Esox lucius TaxID=8010 RepID=A0AAY5KPB2_ESOLU